MKATGKITIEEGFDLNSPTVQVANINYDLINNLIKVECIFNEENALVKHSRTFDFPFEVGDNPNKVAKKLMQKHGELKKFKDEIITS